MVFAHNTTLVVGAGASREFGMPLGSELAATIAAEAGQMAIRGRNYDGPHTNVLLSLMKSYGGQGLGDALVKMGIIATGVTTSSSIDNYLDRMKDDQQVLDIGKLLIAHFIQYAEGKSSLRVVQTKSGALAPIDLARPTWLRALTLRLFEDLPRTELPHLGDNLTIVSFNYDRCIERYLQEAIRAGYDVSEDEAHRIAGQIRILRPYGGLGPLPPNPTSHDQNYVPYGDETARTGIVRIAKNIRTFTEQLDDGAEVVKAARQSLSASKQIMILGFGYHRQNMKLLTVPPRDEGSPAADLRHLVRVYATGIGVSSEEAHTVVKSIVGALALGAPVQVKLALNTGAVELFALHGRNIT